MAVPTVTSITPSSGHTGGGTVLRIDGTNFQVPSSTSTHQTVRVLVGGTEARRVRVTSSTRLYVTTERRDAGLVGVEVRNVGPFGETIGAESLTVAGAFTYARPDFTQESGVVKIIRALHTELVRQVFPEVVLTAHVDWTDSPASVLRKVAQAKIPCVVLSGPTFRESLFHRTSEQRYEPTTVEGHVLQHRSARCVDLVFGFGALSDNMVQLLNMTNALEDFVLRTPWLSVDPGDGTTLSFELYREADMSVDSSPDESNVRSAFGTLVVLAVDVLGIPGFDADQAVTAHPTLDLDPTFETSPDVES